MIFCYRCGVQLAPEARVCPLCETAIPAEAQMQEQAATPWVTGFPQTPSEASATGRNSAPWADHITQIVLTLALLTPIPILLFIWWLQDPGAPWIIWLAGGAFFLWSILVPARRLYRRPLLMSLVTGGLALSLLVAIDLSIPPLDWSRNVAAPAAALATVMVLICHRVSNGLSRWNLPTLSIVFLCAAILSTVVDGLINRYVGQPFIGAMSILLVLAVPATAIAYYLHYIAGVRIDLQKVFHT